MWKLGVEEGFQYSGLVHVSGSRERDAVGRHTDNASGSCSVRQAENDGSRTWRFSDFCCRRYNEEELLSDMTVVSEVRRQHQRGSVAR